MRTTSRFVAALLLMLFAAAGPALAYEVAVVAPALTSTFHVAVAEGALEEGTRLGWTVHILAADRETNFIQQMALVEDMITRGIDAISVSAINDQALATTVEHANSVRVPMFSHNTLTPLPSGEVVAYIGYNQREGGYKLGHEAARLLTEKYGEPRGKVAILEGVPGFHNTERTEGFRAAIAEYPNIEIVASQPANWLRQEGLVVAENILNSFPDVDLFFGASDAMAQGAAQAAAAMGKEVFTIGIDGNPDMLEDIKNGVTTSTLFVDPFGMGRTVIQIMKAYLDGEPVPQFVETETFVVNKHNIDEFLGK